MAETMAELNKQYSPQGIVPDINKPIAISQTFNLNQNNYFTVPETGFYSVTVFNNVSGGNIGLTIDMVDNNNTVLLSLYYLRMYASGVSQWATVNYMGFLEKGTILNVYPIATAGNRVDVKALKAKAVSID